MDKFFSRPAAEVSSELLGMTLSINDREAVIRKVLPQFTHENRNWTDRPLFRQGVEAYVASYRGSSLTFLRTGSDVAQSCVRLDSVETEDEVVRGPGRVSRLFGLEAELIGRVSLQHGIIVAEFQPIAQ